MTSLKTFLSLSAAVLGLALVQCKKQDAAPAAPPPVQEQRAPESAAAPQQAPATVSDVVKAKRPAGGEYLGLYLVDKKVGYVFNDLGLIPGREDRVRAINELHFKAQVGARLSERVHREERIYEARPGGRLVAFTIEQHGDGGTQTLVGNATPTGISVVRKRPGMQDETVNLPATTEVVEDADQVRVALLRRKDVSGAVLDGMDLGTYKLATTVQPSEERLISGVKVKVGRAVSVSDKEKVPVTAWVAEEDGRLLEMEYGQTMKARAEPEAVAKRLDLVEVFGLTRVVLPKALPESAHAIPGEVKLVMENLPEKFQQDSYRQKYQREKDGRVLVTLSAKPPEPKVLKPRPLADPEGGENLKTSIIIESDNPRIVEQSRMLVGGEKDAYAAAKKIVEWVATALQKDYGASADRATDVLRQRKGDCTEHSLLTVSLLRAAGIPARRVDGVIYMVNADGVPALYWHEWVEAFVGEWTQMDPTFNQVVADATHFGVGREGNAEITPLIGSLKVLEVK
ncbi:transglutaminase-like superfamily domain protein [Cystobacter fuscus]|uniref:Transglutaminase-like superfamily domain protein n=1 Tax=Cystobacter fuscus TaxID=43 RepID=A0A250JGT9_9BACT|nr:transglutaminase-like domain-containing protein [Cystobacter fuscus]ATB42818.1 transglutaminase-like superfamily domain protein [Cystobacter fuscus]